MEDTGQDNAGQKDTSAAQPVEAGPESAQQPAPPTPAPEEAEAASPDPEEDNPDTDTDGVDDGQADRVSGQPDEGDEDRGAAAE